MIISNKQKQQKAGFANICLLLIILLVSACSTSDVKETAGGVTSVFEHLNGEPVVPRAANTIYVEPFGNTSSLNGLEDRFMTRFYTLITTDGRLALIKSEDNADIIMRGAILSIEIQNITYSKFGQPDKKRVRIRANVKLIDNKKKKIIFDDSEVQAFTEFSEITPPIIQEFQAVETTLDTLAKRLFSKIINGWYTDQMLKFEKGQK